MATSTYQKEFPIAFAEQKDHPSITTTEFYVEWLENSSEFPVLSSSTAINDSNLTSGNWELLQRKDILDEEGLHILVPVEEEEEWSKLNAVEKEELYSKIIEKNAQELQPKSYTVQPLWTNENKSDNNNKLSAAITDDEDEEYEDDLGAELIDIQKSQSRRASRLSNRRRLHDLRTVDINIHGIYKLATHKGVQTPSEADRAVQYRGSIARSDKANALVLCSKYSHNYKKRTFKYMVTNKKTSQEEHSEYNVYTKIIERL